MIVVARVSRAVEGRRFATGKKPPNDLGLFTPLDAGWDGAAASATSGLVRAPAAWWIAAHFLKSCLCGGITLIHRGEQSLV